MWSSCSEMYVTDQDAEFRGDLLGKGTFPIELEGATCISWPNCHDESSSSLSLLGISARTFNLENENYVSWGSFCGGHEGKLYSALLATTSSNNSSYNKSSETPIKEATTSQQNYARIESQSMTRDELSLVHHDGLPLCLNSTKRSRSNEEDFHQVLGRNVKPKTVIRRLDFSSSCNDGLGGESRSSPSNTEEDSNGETICSTVNPKSNRKTRSSRGTATDPQSLYARKRRERINERLKILQSIIPNGTKVDISTMLDEAVHYVKFLQLQIRLLSSDEMWMYAPIAYNGTDANVNSWRPN